ncbi:hypothetical protein GCM10022222_44000 [Amycolatopsis ultiminotia]|uniref:Uncharacterized protein n=1 Tax=Amycolatopsis ultiminotia TaxID=543629 RepID=A0ABP6WTU5_9PSEU
MAVPGPLALLVCRAKGIASVPVPRLVETQHGTRLVRETARVHASPDDARTRARN